MDADQTASGADQTSSGADQTASDRDERDAMSGQAASDDDQASFDRERRLPAETSAESTHAASSQSRQASSIRRLASHAGRVMTRGSRGATADNRDATSQNRDDQAHRRDVVAEASDRSIAASHSPLAEKFERLRARAAGDRRRAAEDRLDAARERARLEAELQTAHLDELTGAYRREMGTVALTHEIERSLRADGNFVIAFVDIDGMKEVNDRDGHAAGDHVLKKVVWHMRSNLRSFDPVVRYGGDEFVAGLGGMRLEDARRRFARIDRAIRDEVGVGISVGLAELEPDDTLERLTARADARLLDARSRRAR